MLMKVKGTFDGKHIVLNESVPLSVGQEVTVTFSKPSSFDQPIDFSQFMGRGKRLLEMDAQEYINQLRANDRT